jgi:hypothetical protein
MMIRPRRNDHVLCPEFAARCCQKKSPVFPSNASHSGFQLHGQVELPGVHFEIVGDFVFPRQILAVFCRKLKTNYSAPSSRRIRHHS